MTKTYEVATDRPQVLGVLGGMGPLATADFLAKLIRATPAARDQDHLPVIICSFPNIPDRTEAIMSGGPSPLASMRRAMRVLCSCGSARIAIPCNTAHHWFEELQACSPFKILHIVDAVLEELVLRSFTHANVALLATAATLRSGVYGKRLLGAGFRIMLPRRRRTAGIERRNTRCQTRTDRK
ncbi:MAG: aspartate/glutamate racemase family protein, partial [Steroidobacteraceae bacterium]